VGIQNLYTRAILYKIRAKFIYVELNLFTGHGCVKLYIFCHIVMYFAWYRLGLWDNYLCIGLKLLTAHE